MSEPGDAETPETPRATLWPRGGRTDGSDADPAPVRITVYIVSGRHGFLTVPEGFCRECHLFVRAADVAAERAEVPVDVRVVSWWTRFPWALRYGGYHPPVMVVRNTRIAQGYDVPSPDEIVEAIEAGI